jgi:YteA family regulatory protein
LNAEKCKLLTERLYAEKQDLLKQITSLEETGLDGSLAYSIGELSVCDNHPADIGDELFERSKDLALKDNAQILLKRIEIALEKIENGTYEYCSKCGKHIPISRLEANPWASECIQCQEQDDNLDPAAFRPLEEEVLTPPFRQNFLDHDKNEFIGFDGEDALQAVMRYGSSDSPQDITGARDYKKLFANSNEHQGIVDPADAIPVKESNKNE